MMDEIEFGGEHHSGRPRRPLMQAIGRGLRGRCPHCGEGRLFRGYLKIADNCAVCGEEFHHHRADDLPAYLVIAIVGHIVIGAFMGVEAETTLSMWAHLAIWVPLTLVLTLALLQPVKGGVVGLQWALYMHGFGGEPEKLDVHPELG
jgi:uncharacterized protein (DUF983 family)